MRFVYASLFRSHIRQTRLQIRFGLRIADTETHIINKDALAPAQMARRQSQQRVG